MTKYKYTDKCAWIFPFGGCREEAICRKMVTAGLEWLDEHPDADGEKNLRNVIINAVEGDCTHVMIFTAFAHAFRARKLGWDAYIREWEQAGEEKRKEQEQKKQATTNK